jgi:potassium-dependent mechanosensitive channel
VTRAGGYVAVAVFAAALFSNTIGCVNLGDFLGNTALRSAYLAVILYAATRVADGLLAGALSVQPLAGLRMVRNHRSLLWQRIHRLFGVGALCFWAFFALTIPLWIDNVQALLCRDGQWTLLGQVLVFGAVVWAAFLISRFVRFVMEEDLYPRMRMERGLSYAVSTMLHYAVLLFGFYTAAALAGIDMTKFNILVGAFGVGMGFGLQNIINNFVSGIILLFERPVKVGDVVQVDAISGTVDRIGIRASIIRTGTGSEIIVPNGKLISDQVTNWTLSNRLRGIDLAVSVVDDVDPCVVIELLKKVASEHPMVCAKPAPNALLAELGTDALHFKLTAWTEHFDQWGQIRSDLAVAVHAAFAREGIRRPAPASASK